MMDYIINNLQTLIFDGQRPGILKATAADVFVLTFILL